MNRLALGYFFGNAIVGNVAPSGYKFLTLNGKILTLNGKNLMVASNG